MLGRLLARLAVLHGGAARRSGNATRRAPAAPTATRCSTPDDDTRRDYRAIYDASGDAGMLDTLVARLAPGGEIVLAGFYSERLSLRLPARLHARGALPHRRAMAAAPTSPRSRDLADRGRLVARRPDHPPRAPPTQAPDAYRTAFGDPACLKMILDWRACA